jgi:hypothetical protein
MASLRESQAALDLLASTAVAEEARILGDEVGACVFVLCKALDKKLNPTGTEGRVQSPGSGNTEPEQAT